jgi:YVTN family beta-propeller protein
MNLVCAQRINKRRVSLLIFGILIVLAGPANAFTAYVSNEKSNTISVVDTDKMETIKTIKVGQRPRGIELTKDDKYCLVAVGDDDTIQVVDTKTGEVIANLPSGPDPELFILSPNGGLLYVANENNNTVTVIDMEKRVSLGEVQVGVEPEGMGISPDGKSLPTCSWIHAPVSRCSKVTHRNSGFHLKLAARSASSIRPSTKSSKRSTSPSLGCAAKLSSPWVLASQKMARPALWRSDRPTE